jgi:hypothetical protein
LLKNENIIQIYIEFTLTNKYDVELWSRISTLTHKKSTLPNLAFILIILLAGCAKQSALFKVNMEPESVYSNNMTQFIRTKVSYDGPADFLNELSNQGMSNPTIATDSMVVTGEFKTGKMDTLGYFPVTTEIIEFKGGVANTMDMRMMAFGKGRIYGFPEFDSIYSPWRARNQP